MKKKLSLLMVVFLGIVAFATAAWREASEPATVYSWENGSANYTETGGTAKADTDNGDLTKNYIRLKGKADFSTNTVTITLNNALHAGDKILVTGYKDKNETGKQTDCRNYAHRNCMPRCRPGTAPARARRKA